MNPHFEYHHQVGSNEIDDLGHAGNVQFIQWMQAAAIAHSSAVGWPPERYQTLGAGWVVHSHAITYRMPAFEGEKILIRTWVQDIKAASSRRRYEIYNGEGRLIATAETNWAFVNYETQKPTRIPNEVSERFTPPKNY